MTRWLFKREGKVPSLPIRGKFYFVIEDQGVWIIYDTALAAHICTEYDCKIWTADTEQEAVALMALFDEVRTKEVASDD